MEERPFIEDDNEPLEIDPHDIDDQFRALMAGLRTTIPGVLTMFSFLLVLPIQTFFEDLPDVSRAAYLVAFIAAAIASLLLIAPSVHQRVRAPISGIRRRTLAHVMVSVRLAIIGTFAFIVSVLAVMFVVTAFIITEFWGVIITTLFGLLAAWVWFYLPLVDFQRIDEDSRR